MKRQYILNSWTKIYFVLLTFYFGVSTFAQTYTFTNAGASGNTGPNQMMVDAAYLSTSLEGDVTVIGSGIQTWTVPATGIYYITAEGASGGSTPNATGGAGRIITIEVSLTAGDIIHVLVGQKGGEVTFEGCWSNSPAYVGGGGGGTFIYNATTGQPILISGGGGGAGEGNSDWPYIANGVDASPSNVGNGQSGTSTADSWEGPGTGGTSGSGGLTLGNGGSGGCGYNGNGSQGYYGGFVGSNFLAGGQGGMNNDVCGTTLSVNVHGGFGGGAGAGICVCFEANGGGGGGYSGGGGSGTRVGGGGGGGNFYTGAFISDGLNFGHGQAIFEFACVPTAMVIDETTLPELFGECSVNPAIPTATTDCGVTIFGTPDISLPITAQGTTVINWSYDDGFGHTDNQTQIVNINDVTGPIADLLNLPDLIDECEITSLTDPSATDNCSGFVTVSHDAILPINSQGLTIVTWIYEDENGNATTQTQNVIINDVTSPVLDLSSLPDLTECSGYTPAAPTATDNCLGTIAGTPDLSFPITTPGLNLITWTFEDDNGNSITQTQNITINTVDVSVSVVNSQIHANGLVAAYQWLDCDNDYAEITGEVNQFFEPTSSGSYAVEVTQNGCTDTSICTIIDYSGIVDNGNEYFNLFPNPSSNGLFTIEYEGEIYLVQVLDLTGRILNVDFDINTRMINGSELASGKYVIRIQTNNGIITQTIIVSR